MRVRGQRRFWTRLMSLAVMVCLGSLSGEALRGASAPDDFSVAARGLKKAARKGDLEGMAYYVESLGQNPSLESVKLILWAGEQIAEEPVRNSVRRALGWIDVPAVLTFYEDQLSSSRKTRRVLLIIEALEILEAPGAVPALVASLKNQTQPHVLIRTVQALRRKPLKESIDGLIAFYKLAEREENKLWAEIRISLQTLTGREFISYEDWANWWLTNRDRWTPITGASEKKAVTGVYRPEQGDLELPKVFGQEIPSTRVLFLIDTSRSMAKDFDDEAEEGSMGAGQSRLQRAQYELVKAVGALRPEVLFGVIAYNTDFLPWSDNLKLHPATARHKQRAQEFIGSWSPEGTTSTGLALMRSLDIPELDTIVLLSDGSPTDMDSGEVVEVEPILEAVAAKNRFLGVSIHTLSFKGAKVSFMRALARQNDGTYAHIR